MLRAAGRHAGGAAMRANMRPASMGAAVARWTAVARTAQTQIQTRTLVSSHRPLLANAAATPSAPSKQTSPPAGAKAPPQQQQAGQGQQQQQHGAGPKKPRSWVRVALWTGAGLVAASSAALFFIDQKMQTSSKVRDGTGNLSTFANALLRLWRDAYCAVRIVSDYELTLRNLEGAELERVRNEVHLRSAIRLRDLISANGGIYIKFGQHIAQMLYLLPDEYVLTMACMLNQAPTSSMAEVEAVFRSEFGCGPLDIYETFDPVPIASASLAQVHFATLKRTSPNDPEKRVAVKVQHQALQRNCDSDIATIRFIIDLIHRFDPRFDYQWLAEEMSQSLPQELDFAHEARNSERARANLRCDHRSDVNVPRIFWHATRKRVLTMERMDGCVANDVASLKRMGIDTRAVSSLLSQVFSEMIFMHGFVHCDPHAGNVLVQRRSAHDSRPRLILLDHGLYRELTREFRLSYAHLWQSLIRGDKEGIKKYAQQMNAGEMYPLFASMLTRKAFDDITAKKNDLNALVSKNDESEREKLQAWALQHSEDVQRILAKVPRQLLLLLKTNDCLRAVDTQLGTPINSFIIMAGFCTRAINQDRIASSASPWVWITATLDTLAMDVRIAIYSLAITFASWIRAFKPTVPTTAAIVEAATTHTQTI